MGLFRALWNGVKWLAGLVFPFLAKAGDFQTMASDIAGVCTSCCWPWCWLF